MTIEEEIREAYDAGYREGRLGGNTRPYGYTHEVLREAWRDGYDAGEKERQAAKKGAKK